MLNRTTPKSPHQSTGQKAPKRKVSRVPSAVAPDSSKIDPSSPIAHPLMGGSSRVKEIALVRTATDLTSKRSPTDTDIDGFTTAPSMVVAGAKPTVTVLDSKCTIADLLTNPEERHIDISTNMEHYTTAATSMVSKGTQTTSLFHTTTVASTPYSNQLLTSQWITADLPTADDDNANINARFMATYSTENLEGAPDPVRNTAPRSEEILTSMNDRSTPGTTTESMLSKGPQTTSVFHTTTVASTPYSSKELLISQCTIADLPTADDDNANINARFMATYSTENLEGAPDFDMRQKELMLAIHPIIKYLLTELEKEHTNDAKLQTIETHFETLFKKDGVDEVGFTMIQENAVDRLLTLVNNESLPPRQQQIIFEALDFLHTFTLDTMERLKVQETRWFQTLLDDEAPHRIREEKRLLLLRDAETPRTACTVLTTTSASAATSHKKVPAPRRNI